MARRLLIAASCAAALTGCGGKDSDGDKDRAPADATPEITALTQEQVQAFPLGSTRADIERAGATELPKSEYAFDAEQRRSCVFYANQGPDGRIAFDNVWRFCFKKDKLISVSTSPSVATAGKDAAKPSKGKAGKDLVGKKKN